MKIDPKAIGASIVRVSRGLTGRFDLDGTGFLVSPRCVVTSLHVVADDSVESALQGLDKGFAPAQEEILIRFTDEIDGYRRGTLVAVCPPDGALIRLHEPVARQPIRFVRNIRSHHKAAISANGAFAAGFSPVHYEELLVSPVQRIISSFGPAVTGRPLNFQIEGGLPDGMSGSPVVVPFGDEWLCMGMLYRGGDDSSSSRMMLSNELVTMIDQYDDEPLTAVDADDCLSLTSADSEGDELLQFGSIQKQLFLRYGNSAGHLTAANEPISLSTVYVHRLPQENEIKRLLQSSQKDGVWISVEGQAGAGKTSLLWYLHSVISEDRGFVVMPFCAQYMTKDCGKEMSLIEAHLDRHPDRSSIVIIDTLDLIVGRGDNVLASFLGWLKTQRVFTITTCRPLEAQRLSLLELPSHVVKLGRYSPTEAKIAIRKYIDVAYGNLEPQRTVQEEDLWNLLDGRRRVQELSFEPLLLRMMFEAYPPEPIPPEVNTALIYAEYWERCVIRDRLRMSDQQSERLREMVATRLANAILFREIAAFDDAISGEDFANTWSKEELGLFPWNTLESLLSSGVIEQGGGIRSVRFFHQTLLEFAGARFMLQATSVVRQSCLDRILSDINAGVLLQSPVLIQVAVQDAQAGGHYWKNVLELLLDIGSEVACHLSMEILGKIQELTFCSKVWRAWAERHFHKLASCALEAVSYYPKPRIAFGLTILESILHTDDSRDIYGRCTERFAALDPDAVLDFLRRTESFATKHPLADDDLRVRYKLALLACFDAGRQDSLRILASAFVHLNPGQQESTFASLCHKVDGDSADSIAAFLRDVFPIVVGPHASEMIPGVVTLLRRLEGASPQLARQVATELLAAGRPPRSIDWAQLLGGLKGSVLKTSETLKEALQNITASDHLERLTAASILAVAEEGEHSLIVDSLLALDLNSLSNSVRASLFTAIVGAGETQPDKLLRFITACPWPENDGGYAWRKISVILATTRPLQFKSWLMSRLNHDRMAAKITAVGISHLLKITPETFTEDDIAMVMHRVLGGGLEYRRALAENTSSIVRVTPALASRIVTEFMRRRHREIWASLAFSMKNCFAEQPEWVLSHLPLIIETAVTYQEEGLFDKLLEALRSWPLERAPQLISIIEAKLTVEMLAAFPQEKCQIEFLQFLQSVVVPCQPYRALLLLKRAVITTDGSTAAAAAVAASIAMNTSDEQILIDVLDLIIGGRPRAHQRNAIHAALHSIDRKLGGRHVINRFFALYEGIPEAYLKPLIRAVHSLPSWQPDDTARLLSNTRVIAGKIRSYIMSLD